MTCNHTPGMWCVHLNSLIFLVVDILPHVVNIILQRCFGWPCTYYGMYLWPSSHIFITTLLVPRWVIVVNNIPPKEFILCCNIYWLSFVLTFRYTVPLYNLFRDKTVWFLACVLRVWWHNSCYMYNVFRISYTILDSSQQCKLHLTGCHTYTPTYVWSSNTCYWYLVRQKKQRSSNRITYRIAGNFRGRTFHKLVERRSC